ncbi:chymotrypsinogen A [Folsomia candida]|nr:chymotrypsinogen A [Folsomia candida]
MNTIKWKIILFAVSLVICFEIVSPTTPPPPSSCSCGVTSTQTSRRIGGSEAALGEFPWRCNLNTTRFGGVFCTCTIISPNWIMTAAHCTKILRPSDILYIDIGDLDLTSQTETANYWVEAERVISHPAYERYTLSHDIALIQLKTPVTFSSTVQPACLPFPFAQINLEGSRATMSGWGMTVYGGPTGQRLMKTEVSIVPEHVCRNAWSQQLAPNILCTSEMGKSVCHVDSGGGIDFRSNGRWYAVGVTSAGGTGCRTHYPNIFTKVSSYLDWIIGTTGEQFCGN